MNRLETPRAKSRKWWQTGSERNLENDGSCHEAKDTLGHVFFQHPFSDIPREMLLPTIIQHAKASKITFRESLDHTRRTVYVMAKGSPFDIRHNAAREPSTQRRLFGLA